MLRKKLANVVPVELVAEPAGEFGRVDLGHVASVTNAGNVAQKAVAKLHVDLRGFAL